MSSDLQASLVALTAGGGFGADAAALDQAIRDLGKADFGAAAVETELQARLWLAYAGARHWQPVRILTRDRNSRASRGFPDGPPDFIGMRDWCHKRCRHGWAVEQKTIALLSGEAEAGVTFWFEKPADAQSFAMKWLPMKCT